MAAQEYYNPRPASSPPYPVSPPAATHQNPYLSPGAHTHSSQQGPPPPYQAFGSPAQPASPYQHGSTPTGHEKQSYDSQQQHQQQYQQAHAQQQYYHPNPQYPPQQQYSQYPPQQSPYFPPQNGTSPQASGPYGPPRAYSSPRPASQNQQYAQQQQLYPGRYQRPGESSPRPHRRHSDSRSRSRSRSRENRRHQQRRHSHSSKGDSAMDTFLGAGGGAIIGDAIFPGLGTVGGALLGGYGGHQYADNKARKRSSDGRGRHKERD